jgi:hypothetical protein
MGLVGLVVPCLVGAGLVVSLRVRDR